VEINRKGRALDVWRGFAWPSGAVEFVEPGLGDSLCGVEMGLEVGLDGVEDPASIPAEFVPKLVERRLDEVVDDQPLGSDELFGTDTGLLVLCNQFCDVVVAQVELPVEVLSADRGAVRVTVYLGERRCVGVDGGSEVRSAPVARHDATVGPLGARFSPRLCVVANRIEQFVEHGLLATK